MGRGPLAEDWQHHTDRRDRGVWQILADSGRGAESALVYDNRHATTKPATEADANLEKLAVWDAQAHILPILRYHFFREETSFRRLIRAAI